MSTVGQRIAEHRERARMSLRELGARSKVDHSTIGLIEDGQRSPTIATLAKLAGALGCGLVDLLAPEAGLVDLRFPMAAGVALGRLADLEHRMAAQLAEALPDALGTTVSIWPWMEPAADNGVVVSTTTSALRLRCCPSMVPTLAGLAGSRAIGIKLGIPTITPARAGASLRVLVQARDPAEARARLVADANALGSLPQVVAGIRRPLGRSQAWWCSVLGLTQRSAELLVGSRVAGPDLLYVAG